jgi:hypothetical protein
MVALEVLVAGLIFVVVAVLLRLAVIGRRNQHDPITEAQARENAAPLTMAIIVSDRRERPGQ